jgi:LAO/AO transport system kinase
MAESSSEDASESASTANVPSLNPNLDQHTNPRPTRLRPTREYVDGIQDGDRVVLSQAITLLESTREDHRARAQAVLDACLPAAGESLRVAVTGVPGVGKSTFIEALGRRLLDEGHRLAVLAVDPSSETSKGSILGDKTRMGALASDERVFVRPSPTSGHLGGVARRTRETIFLCEAAGFDTVFVETVGVGQSEVSVRTMVDVFLLLALPGAGDQLQGIKRGIVEMADVLAVNKADGDTREAAEHARAEYQRALRLLGPSSSGWEVPVHTCSAETGDGLAAVWQSVRDYETHAKEHGFFDERRRRQARHWMHQAIDEALRADFDRTPAVRAAREDLEAQVLDGELSSVAAANQLLDVYRRALRSDG